MSAAPHALRFASLGSGSKGNATVVQGGGHTVLVDCGFSLRETERRLARLGLAATDLDAIFVTHEHGDHCAGVGALSRRHQIPVYLTWGTASSGRCDKLHRQEVIDSHSEVALGELHVQAVPVPHDAREPCQYRISCGGYSLGILTDLGHITPWLLQSYAGCDALLLESNHDPDMLWAGSYPPGTKRRVAGDYGHLSNAQAAEFLLAWEGDLAILAIAHISQQNNCPERAALALAPGLARADRVVWADQEAGFDWLELSASA